MRGWWYNPGRREPPLPNKRLQHLPFADSLALAAQAVVIRKDVSQSGELHIGVYLIAEGMNEN